MPLRRLTAVGLPVLCVAILTAGPRAASQSPASAYFDAVQLVADLRRLSADDMAGRAAGSAGNARARADLVERFRAVGLTPLAGSFEHAFAETPAAPGARARPGGANVVGLVKGTRTPDRYIVVSAHYDHVGVRGGQVFNGANDNASGAAALAAMGSYFVRYPPATSILFVAFDGEELDLLGSRAFVRAPPVPREAILLNVNADMIGRDASQTLYITGTTRFPFLRPFALRMAASARVRVILGHDGGETGTDWMRQSDQWAFADSGIPALYVGVDDERFLHQADDDFESMMPAFYVGVVEAIIELVREFDAGADEIARARVP